MYARISTPPSFDTDLDLKPEITLYNNKDDEIVIHDYIKKFAWHPDSTHMVVQTPNGELHSVNIIKHKGELLSDQPWAQSNSSFTWSLDGQLLALGNIRSTYIFDPNRNTVVAEFKNNKPTHSIAWHPDGVVALFDFSPFYLRLLDAPSFSYAA